MAFDLQVTSLRTRFCLVCDQPAARWSLGSDCSWSWLWPEFIFPDFRFPSWFCSFSAKWSHTEACTEWFRHEMVLIPTLCFFALSMNFLVATQYCHSLLFKLIALFPHVRWDLVHCLVSEKYQKRQTIFVCVLHLKILESFMQLSDSQKV